MKKTLEELLAPTMIEVNMLHENDEFFIKYNELVTRIVKIDKWSHKTKHGKAAAKVIRILKGKK